MMSKVRRSAFHWAYDLPEIPGSDPTPYWARDTVAEHHNPEYWAMLWGWSRQQVREAKAAAQALLQAVDRSAQPQDRETDDE